MNLRTVFSSFKILSLLVVAGLSGSAFAANSEANSDTNSADGSTAESQRAPAAVSEGTTEGTEKEILREFVKVYQSAKSFKQFAVRTGAHRGLSTDQMADLMGPAYLGPLPKISYDFNKLTVTFQPPQKSKEKAYTLKFISMKTGELEFNGLKFTINPNLNGLENGIILNKAIQKKSAAAKFESIFNLIPFADAQEVVGNVEFEFDEATSDRIAKLREWTVLGYLDGTGQISAASAGAAVGAWAGYAYTGLGVGIIAATAGHYAVKKLHAYNPLLPNCKEQAEEIADKLRSMKAMLSGLSCQNLVGDPRITFVDAGGNTRRLYANWERQDAYFDGTTNLYSFDRKQLKEVRYADYTKEYYNKSKGRYERGSYNVISLKSGEKFNQFKADIEPYRAILEIMGKYESCYRCEGEFHRLLVKPYEFTRDVENFKLETYEDLRSSKSPRKADGSSAVK